METIMEKGAEIQKLADKLRFRVFLQEHSASEVAEEITEFYGPQDIRELVDTLQETRECYCKKCGDKVLCEHEDKEPHQASICGRCQ